MAIMVRAVITVEIDLQLDFQSPDGPSNIDYRLAVEWLLSDCSRTA